MQCNTILFKLLSSYRISIYQLIEIEFFCLHSNIYESVGSCSILFFLAVLKLDRKDCFGYNKEIESMRKTFPTIETYYI